MRSGSNRRGGGTLWNIVEWRSFDSSVERGETSKFD